MNQEPIGLSGYVMSTSTDARVTQLDLTGAGFLNWRGMILNTKWEEYAFESSIALLGEDRFGAQGPWEYVTTCRRSGRRVLILGENTKIADSVLERLRVEEAKTVVLVHLNIKVDELVKEVAAKPGPYTLSFVHARLQSSVLKATSFYGEDIAESSFFRDNLQLLTCYTCGLRDVHSATEVIRIGSDGHIFFYTPRPPLQLANRLAEVENALGFLNKGGFIVQPK